MTANDLRLEFLKRAKVSELMKLTRGIPWEICCMAVVVEQTGKELSAWGPEEWEMSRREKQIWLTSGAIPTVPECMEGYLKQLFPDVEDLVNYGVLRFGADGFRVGRRLLIAAEMTREALVKHMQVIQ
jgi:hypothetical protein